MNLRREKKNQVGGWLHRRHLRRKNKVQHGEETQITKSLRTDGEVKRSLKNQVLLKFGEKKMKRLGKKIQFHQVEVVGDRSKIAQVVRIQAEVDKVR